MTRPFSLPRFARFAVSATLLGTLLGVTTVATSASAHTPSVAATCSTLSVSLKSYSWSESNPKPNRVTVSIDGGEVTSTTFGASFVRDFTLGDSTRAHTWRVAIDAVDNGYDRTVEGTSTPCPAPVPKDAAATVRTTPPTCSSPGTLVLDSPVNASWSTPTATTGPGAYSVTATAAKGHLFDDGTAKRVLTGTLPGALDPASDACRPATTPVATTPRVTPRPTPVAPVQPDTLQLSARSVSVDCDSGMITVTTSTSTTGWVLDAAGTGWVPAQPVVSNSTSRRPAIAGDCPVVATAAVSPAAASAGGAGSATGPLAHAGTDALLAIAVAVILLSAGGVLAARRRGAAPSAIPGPESGADG